MSNIIGFYHEYEEYGCFSNWYLAPFENVGKKFSSVEQYMMYQKAWIFREFELLDKIMATEDPAVIKKHGRSRMTWFNPVTWDCVSRQVVKRGVRAKFEQNPALAEILLSTGEAILAECSYRDKKWGIGIDINDDKCLDVMKWTGNNLLGQVLMEVRDELRRGQLKGNVEYVDAKPLMFAQWEMTAGELKRIPKLYPVIHAFADTLHDDDVRKAFYEYPLIGWEEAMYHNMGGGLPIFGFFEMKQDIFDTMKYN